MNQLQRVLPGRTGVHISAALVREVTTILQVTEIPTVPETRVTTEAIQEVLRLHIIQLPAQAQGVV